MALNLSAAGLDLWTLVHLASGVFVGWWLTRPKGNGWAILAWLGVMILWELQEVATGVSGFGGAETGANMLMDLVAGGLGMWLGWRFTHER